MLPYTKFSLERNEFALGYVICLSLYDTSLNLLSCSYQELMKESSRMPLFDLRKLNASLPVPSVPKSSIKVLVLGAKDDFIVVIIVTSIVDYLILFSNPVANSVMCYSKFPLPFFSKIIVILSGYTVLSKLLTLFQIELAVSWLLRLAGCARTQRNRLVLWCVASLCWRGCSWHDVRLFLGERCKCYSIMARWFKKIEPINLLYGKQTRENLTSLRKWNLFLLHILLATLSRIIIITGDHASEITKDNGVAPPPLAPFFFFF